MIDSFLIGHGSDLPPDLTIVDSQKFQSIRQWKFVQTLDALAQLASEKKCNKSYLDVETQLQRRRLIYEDISADTNPLNEMHRRSLLLNGSGCYKCPKVWCGYFADGFQRREDRDKHVVQHERPFRCSVDECLHAELGFDSVKGLKRHERTSHPNGQDSEWVFPTKKPKTPLDIFSASVKGDLETVKRLVEGGVDINRTTKPNGSITAISLAVKHCRPQIVGYLIGQGCKTPGSKLLDSAIVSSPTNIVQMLLEMEVDSSIKKKRAQDAFFMAVSRGREEVVHLLLTYDIDINERDGNDRSRTALDRARMRGHDHIAQILLDNGAQDEREEAEQIPAPILENFDFDQFLEPDGEFNFDPSVTFENSEGTGVPASSSPIAQGHTQGQAQAEDQQQMSQQHVQQQQDHQEAAAYQQYAQQQAHQQQQHQQQQAARIQYALQKASEAATTQDQQAPQPQMGVHNKLPPLSDAINAANAARQQQQMEIQEQQIKLASQPASQATTTQGQPAPLPQISAQQQAQLIRQQKYQVAAWQQQQQRPQRQQLAEVRQSEDDLLLNSNWLDQ